MKTNILASFRKLAGVCAVSALVAAPALAAPINYGDFEDYANGGVVKYSDVTEAANSAGDEEPLFGAPEVDVNQLDFDPAGFGASASNGDIDITDGQLNFDFSTMVGTPSNSIGVRALEIREGGDYSFFNGGAGTTVNFGMIANVTVTEVNGVALSPAQQFDVSVNSGSSFTAPGGLVQNQPWSLTTTLSFGTELNDRGYGPDAVVTDGEFFLNNTLIASSEQGSLAFLAKKDFKVTPRGPLDPDNVVPEPATALLAGLALAGFAARRR